jgi:DNA-binding MarR family transcriptional regulator
MLAAIPELTQAAIPEPLLAIPEPLPSDIPEPREQPVPPVPETIEETGLSPSVIEQLICKLLYFRGEQLGREVATAAGLKFSLIEAMIESLKHQYFIQVKRSLGMGSSTSVLSLTEAGREHTREFLEKNQYVGPAPVPLYQYTLVVRSQRREPGWLTRETLAHAYRRMVVTPGILSQIGPAVSSGNSFLIHGQPGNGKTYLAEALANLDDSCIYIPHAIECNGAIVQVFDPIHHQPVDDDEPLSAFATEAPYDKRWAKCRRPFLVTGGELSMSMLDLTFNAVSKVYDAPYQVKANNGIYLIDDFGRQRCTPAEVLNRWIVPMERRVDYLTFNSGGKMTVPFEAFLIFSTNLQPEQLGDEAFLRRIQYKMLLRSPDEAEFLEIFHRFCNARELPFDPELPRRFVEKHYRRTGKRFRRCHPRDVLSHAIDMIHFEKREYVLTDEILDRAFESCFLEESDT